MADMNIDQIMASPSSMFKTSTFNRFLFDPLGLFKKSKTVKPATPKNSPMGQWAQDGLYDSIQRGISGRGLVQSQLNTKIDAFKGSWDANSSELESNLDHMVPQGDAKVRNFARGALSRNYASTIQRFKEQDSADLYNQKLEAMGLGMDALNSEKGIAQQIANVQNQGELDAANIGTMMEGVVGGVAGAAGYTMSQTGQQNYANQWNGKAGNDGSNFNAAPDYNENYRYGQPTSYDKATKWDTQYRSMLA